MCYACNVMCDMAVCLLPTAHLNKLIKCPRKKYDEIQCRQAQGTTFGQDQLTAQILDREHLSLFVEKNCEVIAQ